MQVQNLSLFSYGFNTQKYITMILFLIMPDEAGTKVQSYDDGRQTRGECKSVKTTKAITNTSSKVTS